MPKPLKSSPIPAPPDPPSKVEEQSASPPPELSADPPSKDAERVAQWEVAAEAAPTAEDIERLAAARTLAAAAAEQAKVALGAAAAQRACAHGFAQVAEELGVSIKQVHTWRRNHTPDLPDLSFVPGRELRREEVRIDRLAAQVAAIEGIKARMARHEEREARIRALVGGPSRRRPGTRADQTPVPAAKADEPVPAKAGEPAVAKGVEPAAGKPKRGAK